MHGLAKAVVMDYSEKMRQMMRKIEHAKEQEHPQKFVPDPKGFFVILLSGGEILVEHFNASYYNKKLTTGSSDLIISGKSAERLCHTIISRELVSDLRHAAYLGRELAKAENCLKSNKKYVQDE